MAAEDYYHERIARATEQLAQLQARGLLASQRQEAKAKQEQRREEARRRKRVAEVVFAVGCHTMDDAELAGALLRFLDERVNPDTRKSARLSGESFLAHRQAAAYQQS